MKWSFPFSLQVFLLISIPVWSQDFDQYEWKQYDTTSSILANHFIVSFLFNEDSSAWITTNEMGLYHFKGGVFTPIQRPEFVAPPWLMDMVKDSSGRLVIVGSQDQIVRYDPGENRWEVIPFPHQAICIEKNRWENFLISTHITETPQLYQWKDGEMKGLESGRKDVMGLNIAPNGDAMVGFRDGCWRYPVNQDGTYTLPPVKLSDEAFYDMEYDSKGVLWATSFSKLKLHSYDGKQWKIYLNLPEETFYDYRGERQFTASHVLVLPDDRVVVSSQFTPSIAIYDGKKWEAYMPQGIDQFGGFHRIELAPDGSIWCASGQLGLFIFRPKEMPTDTLSDFQIASEGDTASYLGGGRKIFTRGRMEVNTSQYTVYVSDHQKIDGDTISLFLNGRKVLDHYGLTADRHPVDVQLKEGPNELVIYAHNLGSIPPNTAFIQVEAAGIREEFLLDSDLSRSERIVIRWKKKGESKK